LFKDKAGKGYVIHSGKMPLPLAQNVIALPLNML